MKICKWKVNVIENSICWKSEGKISMREEKMNKKYWMGLSGNNHPYGVGVSGNNHPYGVGLSGSNDPYGVGLSESNHPYDVGVSGIGIPEIWTGGEDIFPFSKRVS